jgi:hypothetical protein
VSPTCKSLSLTLCFWGVVTAGMAAGVAAEASPKYPQVLEVRGKVKWTNKDGQVAAPKAKQVLVEKAVLETDAKAEIWLAIDAHRKLRLYPQSRLEIPAISWETGEAPVLILKSGSFRWQQEAKGTYNIALHSDLFEFLSPQGDFVFRFDPATALADVKVLEGQMEFSAMNAEDVALVTAGQKVSFQGVREGDEIVYDVLLKGKKIPRGKLGLVQTQSAAEQKEFSVVQEKAASSARQKKVLAAKKASEKSKDPAAICLAPAARLNQCAWVCDKNPPKEKKVCHLENPEVRCLRRRCNANGEWGEETEVPKDKAAGFCGAEAAVRECDY